MNFNECRFYINSIASALKIILQEEETTEVARNFLYQCMLMFRDGPDRIIVRDDDGFLFLQDLESELSVRGIPETPETLILIGIPCLFLLESIIQKTRERKDDITYCIIDGYFKKYFGRVEIDLAEVYGYLVIAANIKELFCHLISNVIDHDCEIIEIYDAIIQGNLAHVRQYRARARNKISCTQNILQGEICNNIAVRQTVKLRLEFLGLT